MFVIISVLLFYLFLVINTVINRMYMAFYFRIRFEQSFYLNVSAQRSFTAIVQEFNSEVKYRFWFLSRYINVAQGGIAVMVLVIAFE